MILNNFKKATVLSVLLATTSFSMERIDLQEKQYDCLIIDEINDKQIIIIEEVSLEKQIIIFEGELPLSNLSEVSSSEILAKSLAYGLIDGTVSKSTLMLENILYNAIIQKGPDASGFLAEEFGKVVGDEAGKFGVKLTVTALVNALTAPVEGPGMVIYVANMFGMLDGIIKNSILGKMDKHIEKAKIKIAVNAGQGAKKLTKTVLRNSNETQENRELRETCSDLVGDFVEITTCVALDRAEKIFKSRGKQYISDYIRESEYTQNYAELLEIAYTHWSNCPIDKIASCALWFNYPLHQIKKGMIQGVTKELLDNELYFVPKVTSYIWGKAAAFVTTFTSTYVLEKAAEKYVNGISQQCIDSLKESQIMIHLEEYKNLPVNEYLEIVDREIAEAERLEAEEQRLEAEKERQKQHQLRMEEFDRLHDEWYQNELAWPAQQEHEYDLMIAKSYGYEISHNTNWSFYSIVSVPITGARHVCGSIYYGGGVVVNGVVSVVKCGVSILQYFGSVGRDEFKRKMTPDKICTIGYNLSDAAITELFLSIIEKGKLYPGLSQVEILDQLLTKKSNKETFSYKVCDNVVQGVDYLKYALGSNSSASSYGNVIVIEDVEEEKHLFLK